MSKNEFDSSLFEDSSTVHFEDDGGAEFDFLAGFDDEVTDAGEAGADTTAEPAETVEGTGDEADTEGFDEGGEEAPTTEQTETQTEASPTKLTFRVKIDHQDQDVSVDESELPGLYQKAANMDRANQRANEAKQEAAQHKEYIDRIAQAARVLDFQGETSEDVIQAMLDGITASARDAKVQSMMDAGTAKEVAEFIVNQQMQAEPARPAQAEQPPAETGGAPTPEQFSKDLQSLLTRRPELRDLKEFPEEVLSAYAQGENLTVAYLDYESRRNASERNAFENQNKILKQNQESANKAPVRGVAGSGANTAKEDPWLQGFDDEYW